MAAPGDRAMSTPENPADEAAENESDPRASRSERKREATAINGLGLRLIKLSPAQLDRLDLPEDLRRAIELCQGLKIRAQSRQKRLIGQLLRDGDHAAIQRRIEDQAGPHPISVANEKANDRWRARLIEEGDPALQAFIDEFPNADRPQLRGFIRAARQDPEATRSKRAQRELLRAIRAIRS
jgi:ribosome-associated protein